MCVTVYSIVHARTGPVFDGLAHEAAAAAVAALLRASALIGAAVSLVDGQLFLLKHLLTLRDTLRALSVAPAPPERRLDFGHLRAALANLVDMQLLALNRNNPIFAVVPDVTTHAVDVRKGDTLPHTYTHTHNSRLS